MSSSVLRFPERVVKRIFLGMLGALSPHGRGINRLPIETIHSLLFVRFSHIGDLVTLVPVTRALQKRFPGFVCGVWGLPGALDVLRAEPSIAHRHKHHGLSPLSVQQIIEARRIHYDVSFPSVFKKTTVGGLLCRLTAPGSYSFCNGGEKYRGTFDFVSSVPIGTMHATDWLKAVLNDVSGEEVLRDEDMMPGLGLPEEAFTYADSELRRAGIESPFILLNVSARTEERSINVDYARRLIEELRDVTSLPVVISTVPSQYSYFKNLNAETNCYLLPPHPDVLNLAAIISRAAVVISPDTAVVHLASAMRTPVVGLYQSEERCVEWYPYKTLSSLVLAEHQNICERIPARLIAEETATILDLIAKKQDAMRIIRAPNTEIMIPWQYEILCSMSAQRAQQ